MPRPSKKTTTATRAKSSRELSSSSSTEGEKQKTKKKRTSSPTRQSAYFDMRRSFNDSQQSHLCNQALETMVKMACKAECRNNDDFRREFRRNLIILLSQDSSSSYTKWALECVVNFILKMHQLDVKDDDDQGVERGAFTTLDLLFKSTLIPALDDDATFIRVNTCHVLSKIIAGVEDIADEIYADLKDALVKSVASKSADIRAATIKALLRFQEVNSGDDIVTSALLFHLEYDPDAKVRQTALMVIEPSKEVKSELNEKILSRIRDVKDSVRKAAFIKIADRISITTLTMDQRSFIIREGLKDRNPSVRKVVEKQLIISWVKACNENLISLLTLFDIEMEPEIIEMMLKVIFRAYLQQKQDGKSKLHHLVQKFRFDFLDDRKLLLKQPLTIWNSFLWHSLIAFCKEQDMDPLYTESSQETSNPDQEGEMEKFEKIIDEMLLKMQLNQPANVDDEVSSTASTQGSGEMTSEESGPSAAKKSKSAEQIEVDLIDLVLPQLPHFCVYLRKFAALVDKAECDDIQISDYTFIYDQLMKILLLLRVVDSSQKNILLSTIETIVMLPNLSGKLTDVISPLIKVLSQNFFTSSLQLLNFVQSLTQKIHNTIFDADDDATVSSQETQKSSTQMSEDQLRDVELALANIGVQLEDLRDEIEAAVNDQDFLKAEGLKHKRLELEREKDNLMAKKMHARAMNNQTDAPIISQKVDANIVNHQLCHLKCLQLFNSCLVNGNFPELNVPIQTHLDRFCMSGLLSDNLTVRLLSLKAISLCGLIDTEFAMKYFGLLVQAINLDEDPVKFICLEGLIDIICQHSIKDPSGKSDDTVFPDQLLDLFIKLLQSESDTVRLSAVKGVAKMLFLGRISSPELFTRLLIMWYDDDLSEMVKQFLGSWFPLFAYHDNKFRNSLTGQLAFEEAFLPTLERAYRMCLRSDESFEEGDFCISQEKVENLQAFMINLMNESTHTKVSLAVCHKILDLFDKSDSDLYGFEDKILCRSLQLLRVHTATKAQLEELAILLQKIIDYTDHDPTLVSNNSVKKVKKVYDEIQFCLESLKDGNCSDVLMTQETVQ